MQIRRRVRVVEAHLQPCSMTMLYSVLSAAVAVQTSSPSKRDPESLAGRTSHTINLTKIARLLLELTVIGEVLARLRRSGKEGKAKRCRRQRRGRSVDDVTVRTQYERAAAERVAKFCYHCHQDAIWIAMEMPSSGHLLAITAIGGRTNENTCFGAPWQRGIRRQSQFRCCLLPLPAHRKFRNILSGVLLRFGAATINKRSSWSRVPIASTDALADFSIDLNGVTSSPINCRPPATAHQPQPEHWDEIFRGRVKLERDKEVLVLRDDSH
jgi:hypothetical protein